jgi:hypothetical protein
MNDYPFFEMFYPPTHTCVFYTSSNKHTTRETLKMASNWCMTLIYPERCDIAYNRAIL